MVIEYLFLCVTTYASAKLPDQRYELFPVHKIGFGAMFNWSDMRFFLELARIRHLSATATRMRVDTSTVSRRIAELERSLNAKLFERAAEGFFLTEDGQKVFAYAEKMETTAADISFALIRRSAAR